MSKEGTLKHQENSPTASTVGNKLFGPSGEQTYRVQMVSVAGMSASVDVQAATGDEAAEKGLAQLPGGKVVHVSPSPEQKKAAA
jgi:hypothetical protein